MAVKQLRHFEKWRSRLPQRTARFVQLVLDEVVPVFETYGFHRYPDYAGDNTAVVSCTTIALQRRSGRAWPTVEISFDKRARPFLGLTFSMLPELCYRIDADREGVIPRIDANVVEGDAFFFLCKEHGDPLCNFGYAWFALMPERRMRREIDELKDLLPFLMQLFEQGIPSEWYGRTDMVHLHVFANLGARRLAKKPDQTAG